MVATVYRALSADYPTFAAAKVTDFFTVESYNYHKYFSGVGEFSIVIPANVPGGDLVEKNMTICVDGVDFLIVKTIEMTERAYKFSGFDLKYLLSQRVTLFPQEDVEAGTYGYDVVSGATETCVKHYVEYNITDADENRQIYGFTVAADSERGTETDSYMSRLEAVSDVVSTLCKGANLGWDVVMNFSTDKYIFDICEPVDKTDSQTERNSIVFSVQFGNIVSVTRELTASESKNAIYAINGTGTTEPTVTLVNRDEDEAAGIERCETVVNVSCDTVADVSTYALKEAEEMIETDSFTVEAATVNDYGELYEIGDKVTFRYKNLMLDSVIEEVEKSFSGAEKSIKIIAGEKKPKVLNTINGRAHKAQSGVNEGFIEQKSALVVKYNSSTSSLAATNVQEAVDAVAARTVLLDWDSVAIGSDSFVVTANGTDYNFSIPKDADGRITAITDSGKTRSVVYGDE